MMFREGRLAALLLILVSLCVQLNESLHVEIDKNFEDQLIYSNEFHEQDSDTAEDVDDYISKEDSILNRVKRSTYIQGFDDWFSKTYGAKGESGDESEFETKTTPAYKRESLPTPGFKTDSDLFLETVTSHKGYPVSRIGDDLVRSDIPAESRDGEENNTQEKPLIQIQPRSFRKFHNIPSQQPETNSLNTEYSMQSYSSNKELNSNSEGSEDYTYSEDDSSESRDGFDYQLHYPNTEMAANSQSTGGNSERNDVGPLLMSEDMVSERNDVDTLLLSEDMASETKDVDPVLLSEDMASETDDVDSLLLSEDMDSESNNVDTLLLSEDMASEGNHVDPLLLSEGMASKAAGPDSSQKVKRNEYTDNSEEWFPNRKMDLNKVNQWGKTLETEVRDNDRYKYQEEDGLKEETKLIDFTRKVKHDANTDDFEEWFPNHKPDLSKLNKWAAFKTLDENNGSKGQEDGSNEETEILNSPQKVKSNENTDDFEEWLPSHKPHLSKLNQWAAFKTLEMGLDENNGSKGQEEDGSKEETETVHSPHKVKRNEYTDDFEEWFPSHKPNLSKLKRWNAFKTIETRVGEDDGSKRQEKDGSKEETDILDSSQKVKRNEYTNDFEKWFPSHKPNLSKLSQTPAFKTPETPLDETEVSENKDQEEDTQEEQTQSPEALADTDEMNQEKEMQMQTPGLQFKTGDDEVEEVTVAAHNSTETNATAEEDLSSLDSSPMFKSTDSDQSKEFYMSQPQFKSLFPDLLSSGLNFQIFPQLNLGNFGDFGEFGLFGGPPGGHPGGPPGGPPRGAPHRGAPRGPHRGPHLGLEGPGRFGGSSNETLENMNEMSDVLSESNSDFSQPSEGPTNSGKTNFEMNLNVQTNETEALPFPETRPDTPIPIPNDGIGFETNGPEDKFPNFGQGASFNQQNSAKQNSNQQGMNLDSNPMPDLLLNRQPIIPTPGDNGESRPNLRGDVQKEPVIEPRIQDVLTKDDSQQPRGFQEQNPINQPQNQGQFQGMQPNFIESKPKQESFLPNQDQLQRSQQNFVPPATEQGFNRRISTSTPIQGSFEPNRNQLQKPQQSFGTSVPEQGFNRQLPTSGSDLNQRTTQQNHGNSDQAKQLPPQLQKAGNTFGPDFFNSLSNNMGSISMGMPGISELFSMTQKAANEKKQGRNQVPQNRQPPGRIPPRGYAPGTIIPEGVPPGRIPPGRGPAQTPLRRIPPRLPLGKGPAQLPSGKVPPGRPPPQIPPRGNLPPGRFFQKQPQGYSIPQRPYSDRQYPSRYLSPTRPYQRYPLQAYNTARYPARPAVSHPPQTYNQARYPPQTYNQARYPPQTYNQARYPPQTYNQARYPPQTYNQARYPPQTYNQARYPPQTYNQARYPPQTYNQARYPPQTYNQARYPSQTYNQARYPPRAYILTRYPSQNYNYARYPSQNYNYARYPSQNYNYARYPIRTYNDRMYPVGSYNYRRYPIQNYNYQQYPQKQTHTLGYNSPYSNLLRSSPQKLPSQNYYLLPPPKRMSPQRYSQPRYNVGQSGIQLQRQSQPRYLQRQASRFKSSTPADNSNGKLYTPFCTDCKDVSSIVKKLAKMNYVPPPNENNEIHYRSLDQDQLRPSDSSLEHNIKEKSYSFVHGISTSEASSQPTKDESKRSKRQIDEMGMFPSSHLRNRLPNRYFPGYRSMRPISYPMFRSSEMSAPRNNLNYNNRYGNFGRKPITMFRSIDLEPEGELPTGEPVLEKPALENTPIENVTKGNIPIEAQVANVPLEPLVMNAPIDVPMTNAPIEEVPMEGMPIEEPPIGSGPIEEPPMVIDPESPLSAPPPEGEELSPDYKQFNPYLYNYSKSVSVTKKVSYFDDNNTNQINSNSYNRRLRRPFNNPTYNNNNNRVYPYFRPYQNTRTINRFYGYS